MTIEDFAGQFKPAISDVCLSLVDDANGYVRLALQKSTCLTPCIFFAADGRKGHVVIPTVHDSSKDVVASLIQNLRTKSQAVIYVAESWYTETKLSKAQAGKSAKELESSAPLPSTDPAKQEGVMMAIYEGPRQAVAIAKITRDPLFNVGDFELKADTAVGDSAAGRLME